MSTFDLHSCKSMWGKEDKERVFRVFQQCRTQALQHLDQQYLEESAAKKSLPPSSKITSATNADFDAKARCKSLRSHHKATNFTYGDTCFSDFQVLLGNTLPYLTTTTSSSSMPNKLRMIDLGCGHGECVLAAALLHWLDHPAVSSTRFSHILGVDLMHTKVEECRHTVQFLHQYITNEIQSCPEMSIPDIELLEEDFFLLNDVVWQSRTLVYACATCFTADTLALIKEKCSTHLSPGSVVILLDKPCHDAAAVQDWTDMRFLAQQACSTSWGSGIAYVYQKQ